MKKIINILTVSFCFVVWAGCYKDKGNYDYTVPAEVKISAADTTYVTQFDTLSLSVEVDFGGLSADEFEFSWRIWSDAIGNYERKTIASTLDLQYEVNEVPGTYSLVVTARNKQTDVKFYKMIKLLVQGAISEGWMVLHEKDGKTDFDMITSPFFSNRFEEDFVFRNLYESVNGEPFDGRGVLISNYFMIGRYQYVVILSEDGGVRLDATTMQKTFDIPTLMLDGRPLNPENYFYYSYYWALGRGNEVLISDGRFYINEALGSGFTEPILKDGETYRASRWAPTQLWTSISIIYDELHGRFLSVEAPLLTVKNLPPAQGRQFDWNDMKASLHYMGTGFRFYEYGLMEDWATGARTLYVFDFDKKDDFDVAKYSAHACPELSSAKHYAVGQRGNVFYYATEKDIYLYDYAGTNTASKVYRVPDGERLTNMKILKSNVDRYIESHPYDNKVLIISTHNDVTGEGKVYMYYFNESNGTIDLSSEKVFAGFGEILDMDYNFPKYGT